MVNYVRSREIRIMHGRVELEERTLGTQHTYKFEIDTDRMKAWPAEISMIQGGESYRFGLVDLPDTAKDSIKEMGFELEER